MTGRVCEKHGEYCPTGVCRWCDPHAEIGKAILGLIDSLPPPSSGPMVTVHVHAMGAEGVRSVLRSDAFIRAICDAKAREP